MSWFCNPEHTVIAVITASHDLINNLSYKGKRLRDTPHQPEDLYIFKETDDKDKDIS